jgi:arylsulfatase A-like enzyme
VDRRQFLVLLSSAAAMAAARPGRKRPNVVLIMADDMGISDLGCYGSEIDTPNLDRLASGGVRFTQMYNTARCCPTRASLLTGLYPHQAGIGRMVTDLQRPSYRGFLDTDCVTIAEVLKSAGYRTLMSGKWHVGERRPHWPVDRGFDRFYGLVSGASNYFSLDPGRTMALDSELAVPEGDDFYFTDAFTDYATRFIDDRSPDQPFFLYLAYTAPHWPLHAPEVEIRKYQEVYREGWDAVRARRHRRMLEMGLVQDSWGLSPRDPDVPAWENEPEKEWQARRMAVYAAQIDRMDQGIGRVLRKIREIGEEENTLVLFLADNGGCAEPIEANFRNLQGKVRTVGDQVVNYGNLPSILPGPATTFQSYGRGWANVSNTPLRLYKSIVHEGGIATPLIASWPSVIPGGNRLEQQVGHVIDLMPTCLDACRARYPKEYAGHRILPAEGISLLPALRAGKKTTRKALFWEHFGNRAVRSGDWKLVAQKSHGWELYNLREDRTELNNLASRHPDRVAGLNGLYEAWAERCEVLTEEELSGRSYTGPTS